MADSQFGAVCAIHTDKGNGIGVFVSPRRILTCWHVVAGSKQVDVVNDLGWICPMKRGGGAEHRRDAELDLAVLELRDPIGHDFALPPTSSPFSPFGGILNEGPSHCLKTRYGNKPASYEINIDFSSAANGMQGLTNRTQFSGPVRAVPGYSGSPIFGNDGMTLVSVLTSIQPEVQASTERFNRDFASIFGDVPGRQRHATPDALPFIAVRPDLFARWYKQVAAELNF